MRKCEIVVLAALVAGWGCGRNPEPSRHPPAEKKLPAPVQTQAGSPQQPGCHNCHPVVLDQRHDLPCEACHLGDAQATDKRAAHAGLVAEPSHPDRMSRFCGKCHGAIVEQVRAAIHCTVAKEVNAVRQAFGAVAPLDSLTQIPQDGGAPATPLQLADDLLRRRCLRCHLYAPGEAYPATVHGTGCAACHLPFANGVLADHGFVAKPGDQACLGCHYGNRVGADYYGRFDHDVNWDFRTPFWAGEERRQPYGVAYHQFAPDIHRQAGMACIDCHTGKELMAGGERITCLACHGPGTTAGKGASPWRSEQGRREMTLASGVTVAIPVMADPAHDRYESRVGCQVCHAQWTYADRGTHLLRLDDTDFEPWEAVTRQGSAELEKRMETALFVEGGESEAVMSDGVTGKLSPGLWVEAIESRRWEEINICRDERGILQVCRPILDLHLSYTNQEGEVVFDAIAPNKKIAAMVPYIPHTTGKAGVFYRQRLSNFTLP